MEIAIGEQLGDGRFEVTARLGAGAAGVVYEVKDRTNQSRLALKLVQRAGLDEIASLKREFRAVQDVYHPNLVRLDELFAERGVWFFTMELVAGCDWLSYVRGEGSASECVDVERVRRTLAQATEALSALHAKGMVHRDVKPGNILVTDSGKVKVLDFGIVSHNRKREDHEAAGIVGTITHMAPEQLLLEEPTPASDFYALGVMIYQALTGKLPYFDKEGDLPSEKLLGPPTPILSVATGADKELAHLGDALMQDDPSFRPSAQQILDALGSRSVLPGDSGAAGTLRELRAAAPIKEVFVGREAELVALRSAYAEVKRGGTLSVIVVGASGMGKSTLVRAFLGELQGEALVLEGRCHEREYVPYKGVDAIVDSLAEYLAGAPREMLSDLSNDSLRLLPRLFPVLHRVPFFAAPVLEGGGAPQVGDASELRARIFGAFRELLARVARRQPVVLSVDDIQWADGDSLALLCDLLAPPSPPPLLLLCTERPATSPLLKDEARSRHLLPGIVRTLDLSGLSDGDMRKLASQLGDKSESGGEALSLLVHESQGHPLFLQELMRRKSSGTGDTVRLRLDDALWDRVLLLGSDERHLVEATAVAGVPTALELIAVAAEIDEGRITEHVATLRGANLIKLSGSGDRRKIEPYHDRVREAVVHKLSAGESQAWHRRLAEAGEASRERDVERLALHWEGAGDAPRAALLLREAAERASQAFAFDRAVELYQRSSSLGGDAAAKELELPLAEALFNAGRGKEAGLAFLAVAGEGTGRRELELRVRGAQSFFGSGYFEEGILAIKDALVAVDITLPKSNLGVIFRILWHRLLLRIRGFGMRLRKASEIPVQEALRFDVCTAAAYGIGMADTIRGAVLQAQAARLSLPLGDPVRATRAMSGLALSTCTGGRSTKRLTDDAVNKARELLRAAHEPMNEGLVEGASGFAAYMVEEWVAAEGFLRKSEAIFRDARGASYELATSRLMRGRALAQLGRFDELSEYRGPSFRDALRRNDVYAVNNTRAMVIALCALVENDVEGALAAIKEADLSLASYKFQMQHVYCLLTSCSIDLYRQDGAAVLARLDASRPKMRGALFERVQSIRAAIVTFRGRAHLAEAAEGKAGSKEHLAAAERCASLLEAERLPASRAHGRMILAAARLQTGDSVAAVSYLREAVAGYDERQMALYGAAARDALGRILSGDEGALLRAAAKAAMDAQKVVSVERFIDHYAVGFSR